MSYANRNLASIPYSTLIGAPMTAAIEAQALAARTSVDFIQAVGFEEVPTDDGGTTTGVRQVEFTYSRRDDDAENGSRDVTVSVPLLTIVPLPYLRIEDMTIDFATKITEVISRAQSKEVDTNLNLKLGASYGFGPLRVNFKGSFARNSKSSQTSSSRYSTEHSMNIVVNAIQDDLPEGTKRILDMLESAIGESTNSDDATES